MTDLDKMARSLLADQYDCDLPGSEIAQRLRGKFEGQLRVADIVPLAAIRAALLSAPPGYVLVPVGPTGDQLMWMGGYDEASQQRAYAGLINAAPEPEA